MAVIDHLVLAVPDLDRAMDDVAREYGVRPMVGGRHEGLGTHNALVSFGSSYLELIAPDPTQPDPDGPRPFGADGIERSTLVAWAVRPDVTAGESLEALIAACRRVGHDPGDSVPMSRRTPSGAVLRWELTFPTMAHDGLVPFLIDWGETSHPASNAPGGIELVTLSGATDDPDAANGVLTALGVSAFAEPVGDADPGLRADLRATGTNVRTS